MIPVDADGVSQVFETRMVPDRRGLGASETVDTASRGARLVRAFLDKTSVMGACELVHNRTVI